MRLLVDARERTSPRIPALLALLLSAATASAAVMPGQWSLSGGGGAFLGSASSDLAFVYPIGEGPGGPNDVVDRADTGSGTAYSGQVLYHLTPHVGFGAEFIQGDFAKHEQGPVEVGKISRTTILGVARYVFMPERDWNPYLIGGLGLTRASFGESLRDCSSHCSSDFYLGAASPSFNLPTADAGAGLEGSINSIVFAGVEVGFLGTPGASQADSNGKTNRIYPALLPYAEVRAGIRFGGLGR